MDRQIQQPQERALQQQASEIQALQQRVSLVREERQDLQAVAMVKLNGSNYPAWKLSISNFFRLKKLINHLNEPDRATDEACVMDERKAQLYLLNSVDEKTQQRIQGCTSAYSMVNRIITMHENYSKSNVGRLLESFFTYQRPSNESMGEMIAKLERMRNVLATCGQPLTDEIFMNRLLTCLPEGYESFKEVWDSAPPESKNPEELISRIFRREDERKDKLVGQALVARKRMSIEERKKITNCAKCGHKGHWAKECTTKPEDYILKSSSNDEASSTSKANATQRYIAL